jgi:hypothetical protein
MIEYKFIEVPATGFLADILMDLLLIQLLQCNSIGKRLTTRLDGEWNVSLAYGVALSVYRAHAYAPILRVRASQLRNVIGHLTEKKLYFITELVEK